MKITTAGYQGYNKCLKSNENNTPSFKAAILPGLENVLKKNFAKEFNEYVSKEYLPILNKIEEIGGWKNKNLHALDCNVIYNKKRVPKGYELVLETAKNKIVIYKSRFISRFKNNFLKLTERQLEKIAIKDDKNRIKINLGRTYP